MASFLLAIEWNAWIPLDWQSNDANSIWRPAQGTMPNREPFSSTLLSHFNAMTWHWCGTRVHCLGLITSAFGWAPSDSGRHGALITYPRYCWAILSPYYRIMVHAVFWFMWESEWPSWVTSGFRSRRQVLAHGDLYGTTGVWVSLSVPISPFILWQHCISNWMCCYYVPLSLFMAASYMLNLHKAISGYMVIKPASSSRCTSRKGGPLRLLILRGGPPS